MYNKSDKPDHNVEARIRYFTIFVFIVMGLYVWRLFSIQILQGETFKKKSQNISQRSKMIPAQRGEIFDRNIDLPMVLNTNAFAVDVTPGEIPRDSFDTVINKLAGILNVSVNDIHKKIPNTIKRSFQTIEVKANVSYENITNIAERIDELPGVSWHSKPVRNYVDTGSFSHIIGYVGEITKEELKHFYSKGYKQNSVIGKAGIEKEYDEVLRGVEGSEYRTVDVRGRYIENTTVINPPKSGSNLVLTIDRRIQKLAEQALGERIGAAIALKAATGEILAMVSYPYFDQNIFTKDNANELYAKLLRDTKDPLLNRAVNAGYPPASTFKIVMSSAILAEKAYPPEKTVDCLGEIEYGNRLFRCHIRKPGHGKVNLKIALAQSCDIYYWTVCRDYLGIDKMINYITEFGYGDFTEIDLPSQTKGLVPTPRWKERRYHEKWLDGDTMNLSIGQGYMLASPLQVANMVAMVVNNGIIYKPHLLKEIQDPETNMVILEKKPEILKKSSIAPEVFAQVRSDMHYVVTQGSSQYAMRNKTVRLAGKTGTAEVGFHDRWHSWMAAYGPYDGPAEDAIVVVVLVEARNQWEWWAPFATNIIFQGIFANQNYEEAVESLRSLGISLGIRTGVRQE
ncbi:penicillin-binding protein 2 [Treponema phagedenis]|uniref:Penicillin-binding protein 2 n=1 Tax=Treponema phagedenis TaxID=162 RepID=A0A0B7GRU3_TREPH|nr:penicillin-binding protein 2 [Treponema phagedenis]EFW37484.1 penicillin-binding protein 2 [Treponema phagedenis F0421]NVP24763.1 penicillin-binding protein 2 [Treponema phagedenis]QEJ95875.1 penicillin-binding protein 2 [Treponema phagedenis]QEJ98878.1 penicillin-binding protein 2 [Treponema phagedenis]QEK00430.1 penicillin-binding protein 2 [Treponema phagedenis]